MDDQFHIRDAVEGDLPAIMAIFNDAVERTTAVWMLEPVDIAERYAWFHARIEKKCPVLVAIHNAARHAQNTQVVAYGTFGDFRAYEGYRYTVEHSIYVEAAHQGKGIGEALLLKLIGRARELGKHMMVAGIEGDNAASIGLHQKHGFVETARMPQVGAKFGRWLDLVLMQLDLDGRETP